MAFNGIEIDMLSLGDADSILVTRWNNGVPTYILIDGGYARDATTIETFLAGRGVEKVDHLVSTHLHDDHIRGLVRLVQNNKFEISRAWLHQPELHVDTEAMNEALEKTATLKQSRLITASVQAEQNLVQALREREISITEPFQGMMIGSLTVCGPSVAYYEGLLAQYRDVKKIRQLQEEIDRQKTAAEIRKYFGRAAAKLLDVPKTEAENLSCTVLATKLDKDILLLTADAGAESLRYAKEKYDLANCRWMQIPHHGSLYNITQPLVDLFKPKVAFVSAVGNEDHPHPDVIAAFKESGAIVYSTQKPNAHLWFSVGNVPKRDNYGDAVPL
jgi:beta-lactamase superfamily II metal-dependent hydrolase